MSALRDQESETAKAAQTTARASAEEQRFGARTAEAARAVGYSQNTLRARGALTTEFIGALARGEVTLGEFGYQIGQTIAKFGGWTAAAGLVFGAVGAVTELGRGAIDSLSGVNQLQRVVNGLDTTHAQQQFRDLAGEFNLPIKDVADAAYGMGKVFRDQNQIFSATRQALFGVKVGELTAAQSTQYLIAIVNGMKLSAGQLPDVFDALNQAQNKFGGNTAQLIAGIAKAGGSVKAAGGNYRDLIAIIEAGVRLTGASGENIGTAVGRSAAVLQTSQGAARARAAGLDPTKPYFQILDDAFRQAKGASRQKLDQLAGALVPAGGQFKRIFLPLLQNETLFRQVQEAITPGRAHGSAERELRRVLTSPDEQIKQIGVNLQRLGSTFGQSGLLSGFGAFIHLLNEALKLSNSLLEGFNALPAPIREAIGLFGTFYALSAATRRFNVGGRVTGEQPEGLLRRGVVSQFGRDPAALARAEILRGQGVERDQLGQLQAAAAARQQTAGYAADRAGRNAALLKADGAAQADILAADEKAAAAANAYAVAKAEQVDIARAVAANEAQSRNFRRRTGFFGREDPAAAARATGIQFTGPLGHEGGAEPLPIEGGGASPRNTYISNLEESKQRIAESGRFTGRAATTLAGAEAAVKTTGRGFARLAGGFKGFGASLLSSLGPLDVLLLYAIAIPEVIDAVQSQLDAEDKRLASLDKPGGIHARGQRAKGIRNRTPGITDYYQQGVAAYENLVSNAFGLGDIAKAPIDVEKEAAAQAEREAQTQRRLQDRARARIGAGKARPGAVVPFLTTTEIRRNLAGRLAQATTDAERDKAIDLANREIASSYGRSANAGKGAIAATNKLQQDVNRQKADLKLAAGNVLGAIQSLSGIDEITAYIQGEFSLRLKRGAFGRLEQRGAGALLARGYGALPQESDPKKQLADIQALDQLQQQSDQLIDQRLAQQVPYARTAAGARRYRTAALRARYRVDVQGLSQRAAELRKSIGSESEDISVLEKIVNAGGGVDPRTGVYLQKDIAQKKLHSATAARTQDRKALTEVQKARGERQREFRAHQLELQRQDFQDVEAERDAIAEAQQARTADPTVKARGALARAGAKLRETREAFRRRLANQADVSKAEGAFFQAQQQLAQEQVTEFQSRQQLAGAREAVGETQQIQPLRRAVRDAQRFATFVRGQGSKLPPSAYRDALRSVFEAEKALNDFLRQEGAAFLQAQYEHRALIVEGDDPVRAAQIRAREASAVARRFPADTRSGRLTQRNEALKAARDYAQARDQSRLEDISFEADIGKITHDQEISRLQDLLKTVHHNKQLRRDIQRQIYQLKHEADQANTLELNVGNIRLPTIYEIRRAVAGGYSASSGVTVHNSVDLRGMQIHRDVDTDHLGSVLENTLGTGVGAAVRIAGGDGT